MEFLFILNHEKNLCAQRQSIPTVKKPVIVKNRYKHISFDIWRLLGYLTQGMP